MNNRKMFSAIGAMGVLAVCLMAVSPLESGCAVYTPEPSCPTVSCGTECCPDNHYGCNGNQCVLTSCDSGYELCNGVCIVFPSTCCGDYYCYEQECGSNHTCIPVGATDCGGGRYCPIGHGCINNGTACS